MGKRYKFERIHGEAKFVVLMIAEILLEDGVDLMPVDEDEVSIVAVDCKLDSK